MKGTLYCVQNQLNGKMYIGKTYSSIEQRWNEHIKTAHSDADRGKNRPLYRAIRKYGVESFTIESLGVFEQGVLEEAEIRAIKKHKTYSKGYNATLGGDGKKLYNLPEQQVIEDYLKLGSIGKVSEKYGCSDKPIKAILNFHEVEKEFHHSVKRIRIVELDKDFDMIKDAAIFLIDNGYTNSKLISVEVGISKQLRGFRKTYFGMHFEYIP